MKQMQDVQRRLDKLERLPQVQPLPTRLELIRSIALQSLAPQDLELLCSLAKEQAEEKGPRELSEREAASCAAWTAALETQARRMGFRSCAEAEGTARQRR